MTTARSRSRRCAASAWAATVGVTSTWARPAYSARPTTTRPATPSRSRAAAPGSAGPAGVAVAAHDDASLCTATFTGVAVGAKPPPAAGVYGAADQLFLNDLEQRSVLFYFNEANAGTGLVPDSSNANGGSPSAFSSIAALGFGLTALTIGDQRGWLTHAAAYQRAATTINFLNNTAAQVNGFFYHFLNR